MEVIHTVAELHKYLQGVPNNVFVPTMGNLHEGHLRLVEETAPLGACTVVSIFVNRLQFGPREDFDRYPGTLADDCKSWRASTATSSSPRTKRALPGASDLHRCSRLASRTFLRGAVRPGHFRGVATVVLEAVQHGATTRGGIRKKGLPAMSGAADDGAATRAAGGDYSGRDRARRRRPRPSRHATSISRPPSAHGSACTSRPAEVSAAARTGTHSWATIEAEAMTELERHGWRPDYVTVRRRADLQPPKDDDRELVILGAAKLGAHACSTIWSSAWIDGRVISFPPNTRPASATPGKARIADFLRFSRPAQSESGIRPKATAWAVDETGAWRARTTQSTADRFISQSAWPSTHAMRKFARRRQIPPGPTGCCHGRQRSSACGRGGGSARGVALPGHPPRRGR